MPEVSEEDKDSLEVKEQKETTVDKATDTATDNYYVRILTKTAKILTFTNLDEKAAKELKMLQQSHSQMSLIISLLRNKTKLDSGSGNAATRDHEKKKCSVDKQ